MESNIVLDETTKTVMIYLDLTAKTITVNLNAYYDPVTGTFDFSPIDFSNDFFNIS